MASAVGIDLGGTKIAGLRMNERGEVLARDEAPTPSESEAILDEVVRLAGDLGEGRATALGIGAAGMVAFLDGALRFAPNLPLRDVPLRALLEERSGLPCVVDNDSNAAGWAEYRFGAARGHEHVLMLTVGTGIGGAIIVGGSLYRGANGFAAEIGHVIVEPDGPECGCGNRGCWEQVASGKALDRLAIAEARRDPDGAVARKAAGAEVAGRHASEAAREGDDAARAVFEEVGKRLGEGIAGLVNILDPELVVVGGGVAEEGDLLLEPARKAFREAVEAVERRPEVPIVTAKLGNEAGAIGAAALALEVVS
ncbi:MAG: ROK family glucokinase [Actinomycetota bacterium]